jgi:hypothetical protein
LIICLLQKTKGDRRKSLKSRHIIIKLYFMDPQQQKPREQEDLDREEQKETEGGGILGGDGMSSLTSVAGVNLHSSHTDEDGETESSSLGGALGTDTQSVSED